VFFMVKTVNMLRRLTARQDEVQAANAPAPAPTPTEALLMEIRDTLKDRPVPAQAPNAQPVKAPAQKRPASRKSS
jgi:hypothetical protein